MSYVLDIEHKGLNKFRRIRGSDEYVIRRKAEEQQLAWEAQWQRKQALEADRTRRVNIAYGKEAKKVLATSRTSEAQAELNELQTILSRPMKQTKATWNSLYDRKQFDEAN